MQKVIVIGGGIVGSSAAYRLARAGVDVTLVDRRDTGHATAAGAGIICPATAHTPPSLWYPLAFQAVDFYGQLLDRLAEDGETNTGYETVGELLIALDEAEEVRLGDLYRLIEERKWAGVKNIDDLSWLSAAETRSLFPALREGVRAIHISGAARVNGRLIRDSMQRATEKRGGTVVNGDAEIVQDGTRITGVRVDGDYLGADAVLMAAGAWSKQTADVVGVHIPVYPQRGQILHLEMPGAHAERWPIIGGFGDHYMLTFPSSRVVVGATREDSTGYDYRVTARGQHELLSVALRLAPGLADGTFIETRIGFRPMSPDRFPILGQISGIDGFYVATGLGSSGLMMGPYVGAVVADLARGEAPPLDLHPYLPERFARAGAPVA